MSEGLIERMACNTRRNIFDEKGRSAAWSLSQFLFAMSGPAVILAEATLPTCNISNITVEPISELAVIPTAASARLDEVVRACTPGTL